MNKFKYTLFICWAHEWKQCEFETTSKAFLNENTGFYIFELPDQTVWLNKNNIVQMNEQVLNG